MIIKGDKNYKGAYAERPYKKDELIFEFKGDILDHPTKYTIQISAGKHQMDDTGKYINHHCNPTAYVDGHQIRAIRDLDEGTEITFDYNSNEDVMSDPFICNCCGKRIVGRKVAAGVK